MARYIALDDRAYEYVLEHSSPPDDVLRRLAERTAELGAVSGMQIGADQGRFLTTLVRSVGARFAVEVGTFTGYSSICIARGLADGGRLLCCDVSDEWTSIAREAWAEAGVDDRIELVLAPAVETLDGLDPDVRVDFAFIDADKPSYGDYLDRLLPRLSDRGLIAVDNVLWSGAVADPEAEEDGNLAALRAFNDRVVERDDCDVVMLPVGDGVSLITPR